MNNSRTSDDRVLELHRVEGWMFLREAVRDIRSIGALAPSSRALAHALTQPVRAHSGRPLNVLEAGAGTGAVTRALMSALPAGSRLDVVEAHPRFAARLHHLAATHQHLVGPAQQVHIHTRRVEQLDTDRCYDGIVSGLPFANFEPDQVEEIMDRYLKLLYPGGTLTYFAYRGTRKARMLLASRTETLRHRAVEAVLAGYRRHFHTASRTIWANLPPAKVWRLTRPLPAAAPAPHAVAAAGR
jgi:phosphatidylethanolamine/phosphatidyl-N-methylethanolamine N-methyltransferase